MTLASIRQDVEVTMKQGSVKMAEGVAGSAGTPKTIFLGRLICVNNSDIITVHVKPYDLTILQKDPLRTYLGAFLVDDRLCRLTDQRG